MEFRSATDEAVQVLRSLASMASGVRPQVSMEVLVQLIVVSSLRVRTTLADLLRSARPYDHTKMG